MTLFGGAELVINTGWETSIEIPKRFPDKQLEAEKDKEPDVATIKFKEFPKGRGGKKFMMLADLKKEKLFVMHGAYIVPFKRGKQSKPGAGKTPKNKSPPTAVSGLFAPPANNKRRKETAK